MGLRCDLCPRHCQVSKGGRGDCGARTNPDDVRLVPVTWGRLCAVHVDPMEKKPLHHFRPGSPVFSLATPGCNLHCAFCQNAAISQAVPERMDGEPVPPEAIVEQAVRSGCRSIAYTYTEPLVAWEYTLACSRLARGRGLANVLVSAGYLERGPLREILAVTDAANIDLKALSDDFYRTWCKAGLRPVLESLALARETGVHLEVTNLLIPGLNDSAGMVRDLARWVRDNLGPETPLHFSRFHPRHRMLDRPPTPESTQDAACAAALEEGLLHVYGSPRHSDTSCPGCRRVLVRRRGFAVLQNAVLDGRCPSCARAITGRWD